MSIRPDVSWPQIVMARDLAFTVLPCSETVIRRLARLHNIGRMYGRVMGFSSADVQQLHEVLECPSVSLSGRSRHTGSYAAPSGESALKKALALGPVVI